MRRGLWSLWLLAPLMACGPDGGGDGGGGETQQTQTDWQVIGPGTTESDLAGGGGTTGELDFPWNRYFVTEFDLAEVARIRELPGFVANGLDLFLRLPGHPTYGGDGATVRANPLEAARLDYALSTGLTGAGEIVSILDDRIRIGHEQFEGKTFYISGRPPAGADFHGTAVASVAAGTGQGGGALGFAPGADIHLGYLDYDSPVDWTRLGTYMDHAADLGAVVSNNSWGLGDTTLADVDVAAYFAASARSPYIDGLRRFAENGVVVFAMQNDYAATSASLMAGLPLGVPDLESNWISVVNAIPEYDDARILSADRISAPCLETARFCISASGQIRVAGDSADDAYGIGVGASFAAPQVAGSVALLAEAFPDLEADQLRDRLLATADNSFFTPTGEVEFAPNVRHGYDQEFGHGFLDLRAALLPIGEVYVPTGSGARLVAGTPAISGGAASGDALVTSLAATRVVSLDGLHGSFLTSGAFLGTTGGSLDPSASAAAMATRDDAGARLAARRDALSTGRGLAAAGGLLDDPASGELMGARELTLLETETGMRLAALADPVAGDAAGIDVTQSIGLGAGELRLGLSALHVDGSVMGVSVPGHEDGIGSAMRSVHLGYATRLGRDAAIRLDAEFGVADGPGAGMVRDFETVSYDRLGIALDRADLLRKGDLFTVFLRQPVAITEGAAAMELPTSYAQGEVGFSEERIDLAPSERQVDLGFEYGMAMGDRATLSLGMVRSRNHGNVAGRTGLGGFVGVQIDL